MNDLRSRGLLDSTLIVWMGEFGRTPKINENAGRDHFPNAWSTVLAGGGIKGGQVDRRHRAPTAMTVKDRPVAGARPPRHRLQGARDRPDEAEHLRRRPADPDRRPQGQADPGGPRMRPTAASWPSALAAALALGRSPTAPPAAAPPGRRRAATRCRT